MPLQKSYSEHIGLSRRSPWRRSRSNPVNQNQNSRPLQPVAEVTKKKLSKFNYKPPLEEPANDDEGQNARSENAHPRKEDAEKSAATPLNRLTWRDFMDPSGPTEEDTNVSPKDRIMWKNPKADDTYDVLTPMMPSKSRKRARSSSPISSPAEKPITPAVNVKKLAQALKSPHADPTLELWDRYSLNKNEMAPAVGLANPALAQLMISSSPRPSSASTKQTGNLRRTMSYGLGAKRRKIEKSTSANSGRNSQQEMEAASKSSLVTQLLDSVNSSMHDESPTEVREKMAQEGRTTSPTPKNKRMPVESATPCRPPAASNPDAAISDYGDDDFGDFDLDEDSFMELEACINGNQRMEVASVDKEKEKDLPQSPTQGLGIKDAGALPGNRPGKPSPSKRVSPKKARLLEEDLLDGMDEDFGDLDDDDIDFDAVELAATQSVQKAHGSTQTPSRKPKTIQRYLVTKVIEGDYVDKFEVTRPEKILLIQADGSKVSRMVHLRGGWYDTPALPEAYVHIVGDFSSKGECIVDDAENLLILHPDQLISATVVADSFNCLRRAVLQDRVKATSEATPPLVYGTILHEIFQAALLANNWDRPFLTTTINEITQQHLEDLYKIKVSLPLAREHLESKMAEVTSWAAAFVASQPTPDGIVEDRGGKKANMAVTKLLDVEEHVWSPMYGLKGNIDATIEATIVDGKDKRTLTLPFEVKTGKNATSNHTAQTMLYTLLLSDRYDIDIFYGILYYMETSQTKRIPAVRHELRHMVMQRNNLACYIRERSVQLPPMLKSKHMCGKCYAKTSCFVYHRLADDGDGDSSGMKEKFDELVQHLTPHHQGFFVKWENLLTKEEKESMKTKRELWTMTSAEREKHSRCFADVIIEEDSASEDTDNPGINRFRYTFVKRVHPPGFSFLDSQLTAGEPIVVSDEEGHFALAIGFVTKVRKQRISVAVDRRLHNARIRQPGFNEVDNQVFASIMEVAPEGAAPESTHGKIKEAPIRYRLDQDEFSNGMATVRNNLVQMMANDIPQAAKVRSLVVDLTAPRFKPVATQYTVTAGETLNVDQTKAIEKVMSAKDYALVLGMPGTGKTTTIAHIIRALTSQGKTVLLTSHTHTAVDNILLKLKSDNIPILRLGAPAKVHPEVQEFAHLGGLPKKSVEEIKEAWHGTPIVATTCLGINHHVFHERSFDYCIVDEASQITLPICAGPIRMASTFVLVGDHNQLPPVVRNEEAREGGLDVSLFKLLSDSHPESVVNLEHQYRMCEDIMTLSNTLIYDGRLRCGTESLRHRMLEVPKIEALRQKHYDASSLSLPGTPKSFCLGAAPNRCWLYDLLEGEARVRFINTDTLEAEVREEAQGKRIINPAEGRIVSQLVDSLLTVGIAPAEIGVMTHYRSQLFLLKEQLKGYSGVEMHTTDRFQGRDKEVIVLSLVRSNDACNIGDLLKDWRRINVAFTRAKTKLLVVGSMGTLKGCGNENMISQFISLMEDREWIYNLPKDALESHHFDEFGTQITATATATGPTPKRQTQAKNRISPKKVAGMGQPALGKENQRPTPKRATIGERALLKGKVVTRDILNEMTNGAY